MREAFQGILKGFINDSTAKLAEIGELSLKSSAHARPRPASSWSSASVAPSEPVAVIEPGISQTAAVEPVQVEVAPAVPVGKDLSGFGDAVVDDFDFDDLD